MIIFLYEIKELAVGRSDLQFREDQVNILGTKKLSKLLKCHHGGRVCSVVYSTLCDHFIS